FIALQKDITEEMHFRQEIIRVNDRFEIITTRSGIGIWEWLPETRKLSWNEVMYSQYGVRKNETGNDLPGFWLQSIVQEDRDRVRNEVDILRGGDNDSIELEFRIKRFDNRDVRIMHCLLVGERDEQRNIVRMIGTSVDVTEVRNFENNIMLKNEELKKINAELDNFVYSISHDLRSPLLSIKGILALVATSPELNDKNKHFIKLADASAERLDGTIQEILDYSRNARLELKLSEFDLKELFESTFDDLKYSCPENFKFELSIHGKTILRSDRYRVNTIIKNIIGNSVKYYNQKQKNPGVSVTINNEEGTATLIIKDNGEGIPEKNLPKVFDMFFRGTSQVSGTGLGLYICKEIITKLGGDIGITSQVNIGTTVTITIPDSPKYQEL
ncbi:MAG: sensor histidine kinase, partial [Bacteroidota bacterium]